MTTSGGFREFFKSESDWDALGVDESEEFASKPPPDIVPPNAFAQYCNEYTDVTTIGRMHREYKHV